MGQVETVPAPFQNIDGDEYLVGLERSLENEWSTFSECLLGGGDLFVLLVVREVDVATLWEGFCGNSTNVAALAEKVFEDLIGLEFRGIGFVNAPPEEFVALEASHEAGFG